jgi:hypothetical protein
MVPVPAERSTPDQVDGVLEELDPSTLAVMRGEKERIDADPQYVFNQMIRMGQPEVVAFAARNRHRERQVAQAFMREAAQLWMGYQASMGRDIAEAQRRFYHRFKTDVLSAQALGRSDADEMTQLLCNDIVRLDTELRTGATTGGARR